MKPTTILIVDDEADILELVSYHLNREGFQVVCAETGEKALRLAENEPVDLLVLDLMLPGIDGLDITRRLKKNPQTEHIPIIMLTAKGEESDIVTGLELGADDYITKPFSPRILVARVKASLRRMGRTTTRDEDDLISLDRLQIHPGKREVTVDGKPVELTFTEFQVITYLAKRSGWVSTRSQIVDAVRGNDYFVTDRSVDVQIFGLRQKLGPCGSYIQTVRGVGYRLKEEGDENA